MQNYNYITLGYLHQLYHFLLSVFFQSYCMESKFSEKRCRKNTKCDDAYSFKNELYHHIKKHTGENPYMCYKFYHAVKYKLYLHKCMLEILLQNLCVYTYPYLCKSFNHVRKHTGEKTFEYKYCIICINFAFCLSHTKIYYEYKYCKH